MRRHAAPSGLGHKHAPRVAADDRKIAARTIGATDTVVAQGRRRAQDPRTAEAAVPGPPCARASRGQALTEVLPEVAPAGDQALPPRREDVCGGGEAHGLDVPAEGQGAVQLQHRHVEVRRVWVVPRVRGDAGHARPHRAGLRAAQERRARVCHPRSWVLEPAGQTDHGSEAHPWDRRQWEAREAVTGAEH